MGYGYGAAYGNGYGFGPATNLPAGPGLTVIYPLDVAGDLPEVDGGGAFGIVKLTEGYAGDCCRVRRDSDAATQEIGWTLHDLGGGYGCYVWDWEAIETFIGGKTGGRIARLYQQDASGDYAEQADEDLMPRYDGNKLFNRRFPAPHFLTNTVVAPDGTWMDLPAGVEVSRVDFDTWSVWRFNHSLWGGTHVHLGDATTYATSYINAEATFAKMVVAPGPAIASFPLRVDGLISRFMCNGTNTVQQQGSDDTHSIASLAAGTLTGGWLGKNHLGYEQNALFGAQAIFGRVLSAGEITAIRAAYAQIFGCVETVTARLLLDGDSLTDGGISIRNGIDKQGDWGSGTAVYNIGKSGGTVDDYANEEIGGMAGTIGGMIAARSGDWTWAFQMGGNDITASADAATVTANYWAVCDYVVQQGAKAVVVTPSPHGVWDAGMQAVWATFTDNLETDYALHAHDIVLLSNAQANGSADMGDFADTADATKYPDGIHYSEVIGHGFVTALYEAVVVPMLAVDAIATAFAFTDVTDVALSTVQTSDAITVAGLGSGVTVPVMVENGEYRINAGSWTSANGTVENGDEIEVRHTSSGSNGTAVNTVLWVGGVSDTFTSTTTATTTLETLLALLAGTDSVVFDPSDLSGMFTASTGQTAVAADGNTVGFIIDKAQAAGFDTAADWIANLADECTNGDFASATGWTINGTNLAIGSGVLTGTGSSHAAALVRAADSAIVTGDYYVIAGTVSSYVGGDIYWQLFGTGGGPAYNANGTHQAIIVGTGGNNNIGLGTGGVGGFQGVVDDYSVRNIGAFHAVQATAGSRPLYDLTSSIHSLEFDGTDDFIGFVHPGPADATLLIALVTTDAAGMLFSDRAAGGGELVQFEDASASTDLGDEDVYVDGVLFEDGVDTREALREAIADTNYHRIEVRNVNLSGWGGVDLMRNSNGTPGEYVAGKVAAFVLLDNTGLDGDAAAALAAAQAWIDERAGL